MKRRTFIQIAGLGSLTVWAGDAGWYEPNQYEFSFHRLGDQELPTNGTIRFAQLSDIHLSAISDFHERFIKGIVDQRLDFLVFSGDIIERNSQLSVLDEFLSMFPRDQQKYAILGNWEHWGGVSVEKLASVYERYNCRLLINESIVHRTGQSHLLLTGLDDMVGGIPSLEHALIGCEPRANHLLLIHSPVFVEKAHEILLGKESSDSFVPAAELRARHRPLLRPPALGRVLLPRLHPGRVHRPKADAARPHCRDARGQAVSAIALRYLRRFNTRIICVLNASIVKYGISAYTQFHV